jgi:ribonuclease HI
MLCVYTDGASRGNPGRAAAGFMIFKGTQKIFEDFKYIGTATNNEAEYMALIMAMECAKSADLEIKIFSDSELVIKQMRGEYRVKNEKLKRLYESAKNLEKGFTLVSYHNLPREDKRISAVDKRLNIILDSIS